MIEKIDISEFGSYKEYCWKKEVGNDDNSVFKTLNIIYGRNYSGKTTLSRIFRCIENKALHPDYLDANFNMILKDNTEINQNNFTENKQLKVRVYNTDFVKSNLSWFYNEDGSIIPFTVLGKKNVEIEREIAQINGKLGSSDGGQGLLGESSNLKDNYKFV